MNKCNCKVNYPTQVFVHSKREQSNKKTVCPQVLLRGEWFFCAVLMRIWDKALQNGYGIYDYG